MLLKAHYQSGEQFLQDYLPTLTAGGLFLPTRRILNVGTPIVVSVHLGQRRPAILLRGTVAWRRAGRHSTKTRAGVAIGFLASEIQKREYLMAVARGDALAASARRHQRLPIDLPVHWQVPGARHDNAGVLTDIGQGGAFVRTAQPIPGSMDVVLKVATPGAQVAMPVSARIAWVSHGDAEGPGFGVAWKVRDAGGGRRIRELVRRMEALTAGSA